MPSRKTMPKMLIYANIYAYNFASSQATRLTNFNDEFARQLSVSPDGQQIVFERASALWYAPWEEPKVDLWVVDRDGSNLRLLVQNGYAPAWSSREPHVPTPTVTPIPTPNPDEDAEADGRIFLPFTQK